MSALTIIIPTYNRRAVLERTLPAWRVLARRHPLLVVDDGSSDGSAAWLRAEGFAVVAHPRRRGLPSARNTGLRLAATPWVLFGEDDVLMPPDHGQRLLAEALRLPRAGAVAGRMFAGSDWTLPMGTPVDGPGPLLDPSLCLADFSAPLERARPLPSLHACALVERATALRIGGYDPAYSDSAFREESDFYARLWRSGAAAWLTPATWSIHVRHRLAGGCRGDAGLLAKLGNRWSYWRNNERFIVRHRRLWERWSAEAGDARLRARWTRRIASQAWATWRERGWPATRVRP